MKKVIFVLFVFFALCCLLFAANIFIQNFNKEKISLDKYISDIQYMSNMKNYYDVIALCKEALIQYPENDLLYAVKAEAYEGIGDHDKAIGTIDFGIKKTNSSILKEKRQEYSIYEEKEKNEESLPLTWNADLTFTGDAEELLKKSGASSVFITDNVFNYKSDEVFAPFEAVDFSLPSITAEQVQEYERKKLEQIKQQETTSEITTEKVSESVGSSEGNKN